ncbi:MAG: right-handed parallel beta-helix repeat-containing protein [Chloroflexota bacterium]
MKMKNQIWPKLFGGIGVFLLLAILALTLVVWQPSAGAQDGQDTAVIITTLPTEQIIGAETGARVWLEAPNPVNRFETVTIRLMSDGLSTLGGYEIRLIYNPAQLTLLTAAATPGWAGQRGLLAIGTVRQPDGVILSSASCPVANCSSAAYADERRYEPRTAVGPVELATFQFEVRAIGELSIDIADLLLVDAAGAVLLASQRYEADLAADSSQASPPSATTLDLSGNQVVNDADAYMVVDAWRELVKDGRCLEPTIVVYDVNGSGCLNVADIQMILAGWGEWIGPPPTAIETPQVSQTIFVVNSSGDESDMNPGDGQCQTAVGSCTLRAAIEESNALPGADIIHFDIRDPNGSCPNLVTINPGSPLYIDAADNAGVTIDGYTQCNASANDQWINGNAVIKIEIRGTNSVHVYGLYLLSPNNVIKGLAVYNWHRQIQLFGSRAYQNTIEGNFLGTNAANTFTQVAPGIEGEGIRLGNGASNNLIGGTMAAQRNIVSGNDQDGIGLQGNNVESNEFFNNYVGLNQNGTARLRNGGDGVDVAEGVANNQIGGLNPGERNVISGNNRDGVELSHDLGTQGNHIVGNFIGLTPSGNATVYNGGRGVTFEDQVTANLVYRNVIVGNGGDGVRFYTVFDNQLYDNFIGVAPTGLGPRNVIVPIPGAENGLATLPNGTRSGYGMSGVFITAGSQGNHITHNIIAYHPEYGIYVNADRGYLPHATCEAYYNTFSQNSLYDNAAQGIRLRSGICDDGLEYFPNEDIQRPQITAATTTQVTGQTCGGCQVELFLADKTEVNDPDGDNYGEGKTYLAQGTANGSGNFTIAVSGVEVGDILTAHTTDSAGNSSQFARNVEVTTAPTPTSTPTSTSTSTPTPTSTQTPTSTPTSTSTSTPTPTSTQTPTSTPTSTSTFTPTSTQMPTSTPTSTSTSTPTSTQTPTSTLTSTSTSTPTPTSTQTPTSTPTSPPPSDLTNYLYLPLVQQP